MTACALAPLPLPPWISIETTFLISNSTGSIWTSVIEPATETLAKAVLTPVVLSSIVSWGGFNTS